MNFFQRIEKIKKHLVFRKPTLFFDLFKFFVILGGVAQVHLLAPQDIHHVSKDLRQLDRHNYKDFERLPYAPAEDEEDFPLDDENAEDEGSCEDELTSSEESDNGGMSDDAANEAANVAIGGQPMLKVDC